MKRIKSIIVDDERNSRLVLRSLLEAEFDFVDVLAEAGDADEAYEQINVHQPDLVFLDIQMPKFNGFSLLKRFDSVNFEIIFVTSYDNYAINAIKFSALDYLLKPVDIEDLSTALHKAIKVIDLKQNRSDQVLNLLDNISSQVVDRKIVVHKGDKVKFINISDIFYIEGDRRYCHLYTNQNENYIVSKYLRDFEEYFGEESLFLRISKSIMINLNFVKEYTKGDPFIITLTNDKFFEVSRRKKALIIERLKGI